MEVLNDERGHKPEMTKRNSTDEKQTGWMNFGFLGNCLLFSKKDEQHHGGAKPDGHGHCQGTHEKQRAKISAGRDRSVSPLNSTPSPRHAKNTSPSTSTVGMGVDISCQLRHFSFNELRHATRNFKDEAMLGSGGFGRVYKGWVNPVGVSPVKPGSGLAVAVKTLNHGGRQGHREWLAEINYLSKLHHPNLVTLVGFCIEGDKRLLVYEFMARGSLDKHLFRRGYPMPWSRRIKIALDAAKGLAFLHEEAENPVIYRDFKASNILLDLEFNAKLSDFGLAKDGPEGDKSHVSTRVMGTYGYAAPEYVRTGHLTSRSDIYSFGVVLLEMLSGRKSVDRHRPTGNQKLLDWALPYLRDKQQYLSVIDPQLQNCYPIQGARIAVQLAARCISHDPRARPLMSEVVRVLKPISEITDYQTPSAFTRSRNSSSTRSQPQSPRTPSEQPPLPVFPNPRPSPQQQPPPPPTESQSPPA